MVATLDGVKLTLLASLVAVGLALGSCKDDDGEAVCYTPTLNTDKAPHPFDGPDAGAPGCRCDKDRDQPVCATRADGGRVAMFCTDGQWHVGWDGPCAGDGGAR
jgi:hypothetical protein